MIGMGIPAVLFLASMSWECNATDVPSEVGSLGWMKFKPRLTKGRADFQNIGVNGARTSSMASDIMYTLARDQENDYPVNLLYALIGNGM